MYIIVVLELTIFVFVIVVVVLIVVIVRSCQVNVVGWKKDSPSRKKKDFKNK